MRLRLNKSTCLLMTLMMLMVSALSSHAEGPAAAPAGIASTPAGMGAAPSTSAGSPALFGSAPAPLMAPGTAPGNSFAPLNAAQGQPAIAPGTTTTPQSAIQTLQNTPTTAEILPAGSKTSQATAELSAAEMSMSDSSTGAEKSTPQEFKLKNLRQFGYSFFRPDSQGFAALTDVPVGPEYPLGAGDRIVLTLWGSIDGSYELEVNRSGEIILPKVGPVTVAGVTYGQLPKVLKANLSRVFRDFQLNVTMGKLRLIKVYLVGEVTAPGDYSISSFSTLINALSAAGGPTRRGSLRSIAIMRGGTVAETVDLYDFFLKGDKSRDVRLQPGDTIFVPGIGPIAGIGGNVRRPAIYELKNEKTLADLLALADGINPSGYLQRVQISRTVAHDKRLVTDTNLDPKGSGKAIDALTATIPVQDMDIVKIFPIDGTLRGYARLEGYVLRPGDYALKPGMRVEELLQKEGNLLPEYYTESGQIIRLVAPDFHPEIIYFNINQALARNPAHNIELQEFDTVKIFSRWEMEEMPRVTISGEVQKPGTYRLFKNMKVRDLLTFAGNPKLTAYMKDAEITRINRTADSISSSTIKVNLAEVIKDNPKDNIQLEPFDEIAIRRIPNWADETDRYITLKGEFVFPGTYPIFRGERLSSVIQRAGGLTSRAYVNGAKFTRVSVREQQQKRIEEFAAISEQELASKSSELLSTTTSQEELASLKASLDGTRRSLQILKNSKAEGRMVIRIDKMDRFVGSDYDVEIMGGDVLEIPVSSKAVAVIGRVVNQTSFIAQDGKDVDHYLSMAGGTTRDSEADEIFVVRADGSIFSHQQYSSMASLFGHGFLSEPVNSGDTIVVPQRFDKTPIMRYVKDITTIMMNLSLTVGTLWLGLR